MIRLSWDNDNTENKEEEVSEKKSLLEDKIAEKERAKGLSKIKFDWKKAKEASDQKLVFTIYGHKNDGKTSVSYGIPKKGETVAVFSFDHKSKRPLEQEFMQKSGMIADKNVFVLNTVAYLDKSTKELFLETSEVTYNFINYLFENMKDACGGKKPDWIVLDATEVMNNILENVMRFRNGIGVYSGISNFNVWKERKQYIDDIHNKCLNSVGKGVIYTTYIDREEIIKDGQVIKSKDMPKWIGNMMMQTDVVIRVESMFENNKPKYIARIESGSKLPKEYPSGTYDVTNKRLSDVLKEEI